MTDNGLRVLIAGGGTGGHIIPALAVARELVSQRQAEVRFVGTARGLETKLVPAAGFPLELISVGQLNQVSLATKLKTALRLPMNVLDCVRLLRRFRPHAVLGVGGYASGPAMLAAIVAGIPTIAFEPNAVPGMANRIVGSWVRTAAVNFPGTTEYFRNARVTGIPVRPEFFQISDRALEAVPQLLVFGGSQGARVLNRMLPRIAAALLEAIPSLTILHQCGARHVEETERLYGEQEALREKWRGAWKVQPYLEDMPRQIAVASLILCRSGASTMAELAAAGRASLLVPFPLAADDHQRHNAEDFVQAGAAVMLPESQLTPERLLAQLTALLRDPVRLRQMGAAARPLAHPNAAVEIAELVVEQAVSTKE
jgi:UDP-N-acetylglucosamine--N-acetylmuramyl-(pentapeptide) pyrophosphoryl-undecaprenol N-acetylglucosamine transferase